MTERQIILAYENSVKDERVQRANTIADVNHAFAGGKSAEALIKELLGG